MNSIIGLDVFKYFVWIYKRISLLVTSNIFIFIKLLKLFYTVILVLKMHLYFERNIINIRIK